MLVKEKRKQTSAANRLVRATFVPVCKIVDIRYVIDALNSDFFLLHKDTSSLRDPSGRVHANSKSSS